MILSHVITYRMRTTISLDDKIAALAETIAVRENRNFSNLCEVALSAYCQPRMEDNSKEQVLAAAEEVGFDNAIQTLRRSARRKASE